MGAVAISTGPAAVGSAVGVAAAQGLDVPFITGMPGRSSAIHDTPARENLVKNLFVAKNSLAFADDDEIAKDLRVGYARPSWCSSRPWRRRVRTRT